MSLRDGIREIVRKIGHLMRESERDLPQSMAPERPMSFSKPKSQVTLDVREMPRPWAAVEGVSLKHRPHSRMNRLRTRLRQPETLRESIIIKEIIDRPVARRRR